MVLFTLIRDEPIIVGLAALDRQKRIIGQRDALPFNTSGRITRKLKVRERDGPALVRDPCRSARVVTGVRRRGSVGTFFTHQPACCVIGQIDIVVSP